MCVCLWGLTVQHITTCSVGVEGGGASWTGRQSDRAPSSNRRQRWERSGPTAALTLPHTWLCSCASMRRGGQIVCDRTVRIAGVRARCSVVEPGGAGGGRVFAGDARRGEILKSYPFCEARGREGEKKSSKRSKF